MLLYDSLSKMSNFWYFWSFTSINIIPYPPGTSYYNIYWWVIMTNINTACVKNNASYQLNNALPNKETISSNFCERLAQWGNKSLNNGEERAIAVERIKEAYNSNMASLDLSYLDLSELPPIPSTVNTLNLEKTVSLVLTLLTMPASSISTSALIKLKR